MTTRRRKPSETSVITAAAIEEMSAQTPVPDTQATMQAAILQLQRRCTAQDKCIRDLSRTVTQLTHRIYLLTNQD